MRNPFNMFEMVRVLKDELLEKDKLIRNYGQALFKIHELSRGDPKLLKFKVISEHYLRIQDKEEN